MKWDGVGVMKDKKMNLEDVKTPDTLGWVSYNIDSTEEVVVLFDVELQKPRNLSTSESEECGHGEGVGMYVTLLNQIHYRHMVVQYYDWPEKVCMFIEFICSKWLYRCFATE